MKKYKTVIAVIASGILSASVEARPNDRHDDPVRAAESRKAQPVKIVHRHGPVRVVKGPAVNRVVKLPRNHRKVWHRGVVYSVSKGVYYRPFQSGYIVVKAPW